MQPTTDVLARIRTNSSTNKGEVFTRLYRYLLRPDIYFVAYKNLYANNGAATRGVNGDTADGFSEAKIEKTIQSLENGTYQPLPVRRTYIEKKNGNGKKRPLGIPTFTDKLVQEVLRMILEAVYEPVFLECSHGFRPQKSCHTALESLKRDFNGAKWFIEGDIKGCFDNINHSVLIGLLNSKVKDARLMQLVNKFLRAGYLENWKYNATYSGTPQGGIISPLLANIYLHELDKFILSLKVDYDKPRERHHTPEYSNLAYELHKIRVRIADSEGNEREQLLNQHKQTRAQLLKTPCKSQTDKAIKYIRYADDFLIAVKGTHQDCVEIKRKLAEFISNTLKMELSEEKTLITHSNHCARFLGYDVRVRRDNRTIKHGGAGNKTQRTLNNMTELSVPFADKIHSFIFSKGIAVQKADGTLFPVHRDNLVNLPELEIVSTYNAELRGICNYYRIAVNFCRLNYFSYLMEYSCLKTLAKKHKSSIRKELDRYRCGKGTWGIPYETKKGPKRCCFAKYTDAKNAKDPNDPISNVGTIFAHSVNSFEKKLKAKVCELCGTTETSNYQLHHVNKVKNLKGKETWERVMIAKKRKTLVVCENCHNKIHFPVSSK